jgi:hypothetical protein
MPMRNPKKEGLGWFPQLNPQPRMRIAPDGRILYANPASIFLLQELTLDPAHPELLLPVDYQQRLETMRRVRIELSTWHYRVAHHAFVCQVRYLPDRDYFHAFLTDEAIR